VNLENPSDKPTKTDGTDSPTEQNEKKGTKSVTTPANEPQSPPSTYKHKVTCQAAHSWRNDPKFWMEAFGLVVLAAYTSFSGCQTYYARKQAATAVTAADAATKSLDTIKEQFQMDQRPHIAVAILGMTYLKTSKPMAIPIAGQPITINLGLKNIGKSPALNVVVHRHILFDSNLSTFKIEPADTTTNGDAIEAGEVTTTTAVSMKDTFANETMRISGKELLNWEKGGVFVFGRVSYQDSFGNRYCTPYIRNLVGPKTWAPIARLYDHRPADLCPEGKY
jgi:hypothetical protein